MADLTFECPHCKQNIACDEQWSGQQIQCPLCQGALVVPAAQSKKHTNPLVPKPPSGPQPRLGLGQKPGPAPTGNRNIPIRDLAGPARKKQSPLVGIISGTLVVIALGAGGYFGYTWYQGQQEKKARAAEEQRQAEAAAAAAAQKAAEAAAAPKAPPPPKPVAWTLDVAQANIPEGQVNGKISGTNFLAEAVRIDPFGPSHILRFLQGQPVSPDREVFVYLPLKAGEKPGGQTLTVSSDMKSGIPQVTKRWKTNPRYAPTLKSYNWGYAMKLELGKAAEDGSVPGKVFIALPDTEQTVLAGVFRATVTQVDPNAQPAAQYQAPTPAQTVNPDAAAAMQRRYGIKR